MTVEAAPKPADPARTRLDSGQNSRIKNEGAQGKGANAGGFAGLLSLSAEEPDPVEPACDADVGPALTALPADAAPLDLAGMLALLAGLGEAQAPAPALLTVTDATKPGPTAPGLRDGTKSGLRALAAAGAKAPGRADALWPETEGSGKVSAGQPRLGTPGADAAETASGALQPNGHEAGAARAAPWSGGKADALGGMRLADAASEPVPPSQLAVTVGMGDGSGRSPGGNADKAPEMAGKPGLESLNSGASLAADGVGSPTAVAETPSLLISDAMLADTVSYWVSQGVQNAELTLEGLGGEPIEVSIQLANGEALIGFRSDLAQTRQLIEGAMTELKDLLANQGLLLAGVSVGTSSRQDGSPGETPRRPGGRLRGIGLAETAMVQPAPRSLGPVGQRLDLFV
jgi:flagellar hook-length control protein FliK